MTTISVEQQERERILLARALRAYRKELGIPVSTELAELADRTLPAAPA